MDRRRRVEDAKWKVEWKLEEGGGRRKEKEGRGQTGRQEVRKVEANASQKVTKELLEVGCELSAD